MQAGHDSDALAVLAAKVAPFDTADMGELVDEVLAAVSSSPIGDVEVAARMLASIRVQQVLGGKLPARHALKEMFEVCQQFDLVSEVHDFYLLHYAAEDLVTEEVQYYWPDTDRSNIEEVIEQRFREWIADYPVPD